MKVKLLIGANAYACISYDSGRQLDIKLEPGRPAPRALREYAEDQRARARHILEMAAIADRAAAKLESQGYATSAN